MDDLVTGTREEKLDKLSAEWRGNFLADEETEEAYKDGSEVSHRSLAEMSRAVVWHENDGVSSPVLVPYVRWARETVQHAHMVQYVAKHPLAEQGVDWASSVALRKAKEGIAEKIRIMKIMWNLYAYGDVKLLRKHCTPSEAMCTWCGDHLETRDHIIGKGCKSPELAKHKQVLYKQITNKIKEHLRDEDTAEWLSLTIPTLWGGVDHDSNNIGDARIRVMVEGLADWKPQELWNGVVPKRLQDMLECYSIKGNVRKLTQELVTLTEHAATDLWILTNEHKKQDVPTVQGRTLNEQARDIYDLSPAMLGYPISTFDGLPRPHKVNIIRDRKKKLLGKGHDDTRLGRVGQTIRDYGEKGEYLEYQITSVCGISGGRKPYLATKQGGSSVLEGVRRGITYVSLGASTVNDGLVREDGLTRYESSLVHRALHYRKTPKRKSKHKRDSAAKQTGMAAGVLKVRKCNQEVVCDVITLSGEKITDTPAQLFAKYDVKGPIKGRVRRQRVRKNRTLRILEPVQTPSCIAYNCLGPQQVEPLATPTGTEGQDDTVNILGERIAKELKIGR